MRLIFAIVTFVCDVRVKPPWPGIAGNTCNTANFDKNIFPITAASSFNKIDLGVTQALADQTQCKSQYLML